MPPPSKLLPPTPPPPGSPAHCSWKLSQSYLTSASIDQLVQLGKLTSLEHRRHLMDPTLLGLHEASPQGWLAAPRAAHRTGSAGSRSMLDWRRPARQVLTNPRTLVSPPALLQMITYGLRGLAAYSHHAEVLGERDREVGRCRARRPPARCHCLPASVCPCTRGACTGVVHPPPSPPAPPLTRCPQVDEFMASAYAFLCSEEALDLGATLDMVDQTGAAGLKGMRLLDHGARPRLGWAAAAAPGRAGCTQGWPRSPSFASH